MQGNCKTACSSQQDVLKRGEEHREEERVGKRWPLTQNKHYSSHQQKPRYSPFILLCWETKTAGGEGRREQKREDERAEERRDEMRGESRREESREQKRKEERRWDIRREERWDEKGEQRRGVEWREQKRGDERRGGNRRDEMRGESRREESREQKRKMKMIVLWKGSMLSRRVLEDQTGVCCFVSSSSLIRAGHHQPIVVWLIGCLLTCWCKCLFQYM